jgi:hypothetical protein
MLPRLRFLTFVIEPRLNSGVFFIFLVQLHPVHASFAGQLYHK